MRMQIFILALVAGMLSSRPLNAAPEATLRRAPPAVSDAICSRTSWAEDAAEILVSDDGRKLATLPICIPYGRANDLKLIQDANGKAYVFLVRPAYRGSPTQDLLTIYRLDGELREIFSMYMNWPLAASQFFAYDYAVRRNAAGGLSVSFRGRVDGDSGDARWDDPPEHKNMTITIEESD